MVWRRRIYRGKPRDTVHYCANCRWWPTEAGTYREYAEKPSGDLCNECRARARRGRCEAPEVAF